MAFTTSNEHGGQSSDVYRVMPSPGKGLGMFATRYIQQGTRILEDDVLFIIPAGLSEESTIDSVISAYSSLPPDRQNAFSGLHDPHPSKPSHVLNRYKANAFEISNLSEIYTPVISYAVCLQASRINHSCAPNAYLDFNTNIYQVTVHAIADIPAGQEITISYCSPHYTREIRRGYLARYNFVCRCTVCHHSTAVGRLKEAERRLMQADWLTLYDQAGNAKPYPDQEVIRLFRMIRLLKEQGLNVAALSALYQRAAKLHVELGLQPVAASLAEDKLKCEMDRLGPDNPLTQRSMRSVRDLS